MRCLSWAMFEYWEYSLPSRFPWLEIALPCRCCWCCLGHSLPRFEVSSPSHLPQSTRSDQSCPLRKSHTPALQIFHTCTRDYIKPLDIKKPSCSLAKFGSGFRFKLHSLSSLPIQSCLSIPLSGHNQYWPCQ